MRSYHVAPKYGCGSPALVNERTALSVARDEVEFHRHHVEGAYGQTAQAMAVREGLGGIVEARTEFSGGWHVEDVITGRKFDRLTEVKPKDARYGDTIVEVTRGAWTIVGFGSLVLPLRVRRVEKVGTQIVITDADERRLIVPKDARLKIEREERS